MNKLYDYDSISSLKKDVDNIPIGQYVTINEGIKDYIHAKITKFIDNIFTHSIDSYLKIDENTFYSIDETKCIKCNNHKNKILPAILIGGSILIYIIKRMVKNK